MAKLVENSLVIIEMKKNLHPPYSPNLASSYFYLFGRVKQVMAGLSFFKSKELLSAIGATLDGYENAILIAGFR
jgi:hypothetical protein